MEGYIEGDRYKKPLTYVKHFGNSNVRYVVFKDGNGNRLDWTTNDYTKAYQDLWDSQKCGIVSFTVDSIYQGTVNIKNLKIE